MNTSAFLTTNELADRWCCSSATVLKKLRSASIRTRPVVVSPRTVVRLADVEAFEATHRRTRAKAHTSVQFEQR
jgi:hypothetical protein